MNILFVCTANRDRSRSAEAHYKKQCSNHHFRSAGTSETLCSAEQTTFINAELIHWSDLICVMQTEHFEFLHTHFELDGRHIHVLGIDDLYSNGDPVLIDLIIQRCSGLFTCD